MYSVIKEFLCLLPSECKVNLSQQRTLLRHCRKKMLTCKKGQWWRYGNSRWNSPQSWEQIIIPLWLCSLKLVKIFLQPSWPPNQSPHGGLCTVGLLSHPAPGLPMCAYITSCWSPAPPPFPCPATPDQLWHGQTSKYLCHLVGQTTYFPRRSEPVTNLPFLGNTPSALGNHLEFHLILQLVFHHH